MTVRQLNYYLTPVAGLALVGHMLQAIRPVLARIDAALPLKGGVGNSDIVRSYLGLLTQGKSDFDTVENFRGDAFFKQALNIGLLPSSPTLRQRMDMRAAELFEFLPPTIETLLASQRPDWGVLLCGWLRLDVDTFAMDSSGTVNEGVRRTYAGVDGYCPPAVYLGSHGFCLELTLRPGVQHSARETDFNLERVLPMAQRLSAGSAMASILTRFDSGSDSAALIAGIEQRNQLGLPRVDFLIKWNPRATDVGALGARLDADGSTQWMRRREGKRLTTWMDSVQIAGIAPPVRRVLRLTERTINAQGQILLVPDYEIDGWTTSLPVGQFNSAAIIALYADHGTHAQFDSEFKTDLDLTRLPSSKFDTNYLVC